LTSKKEQILTIPDVRRWYENLARGSANTADVRIRRLILFCEQHNMTPMELVELGRQDRKVLEDLLQDHISLMEKKGSSPGYIDCTLKAMRSWLNHNEVEVKRKIKIANRDATPTIQDERVPTLEELRTILLHASDRAKVMICMIAMAGLRLETLGNQDASDGLVVSDLPEMRIDGKKVIFSTTPTKVAVRTNLSKNNRKYFTFLPKEGCDYLKAYLEKRTAAGEKLTSDSPIIAVVPGYEAVGRNSEKKTRFITTRNVSREIRETMRPKFSWRPYVLRAYFDTQLLLAESHGKITHAYRVFFMGHTGDIESRYTTNKGVLPVSLVEDMRQAFIRCEPYLCTVQEKTVDKKEMLLEMWREQARLYGIDPLKVKIEKQRELSRELGQDEEKEAIRSEIAKLAVHPQKLRSTHGKTKLVSEDELTSYLNKGWQLAKELRSGKMLISKAM
jgi:hypothetical protein